MCKHSAVEMPIAYSGKPVSKDHILAHGIGNLQIPFDVGTFRKLKARAEGARQTTYCVDAVFNPLIVQLFMDDAFCNLMAHYRQYIINLVLKRIEDSIGTGLSPSSVKLVKACRYKDGEDEQGTVPRSFTELAGEEDWDLEVPRKASQERPVLIEDVTSGRKPAVKKGFLSGNQKPLYGPEGSKEGVVPENAGDPLGWMPQKLRQSSKIVDCNSPSWQDQQNKKKATEESNAMNQEFSNLLKQDMDKWGKLQAADRWEHDVPDGAEQLSRFDRPEVAGEQTAPGDTQDWYYNRSGQQSFEEGTVLSVAPAAGSSGGSTFKRGFLEDKTSPLSPQGSVQARALPDTEQLLHDMVKVAGPVSAAMMPKARPSNVKAALARPPDFVLSVGCGKLQLVVHVPELQSMQDVSLDVSERRAALAFPAHNGLRKLEVQLPETVLPTSVRAKFSKKAHTIIVTLPTLVPAS